MAKKYGLDFREWLESQESYKEWVKKTFGVDPDAESGEELEGEEKAEGGDGMPSEPTPEKQTNIGQKAYAAAAMGSQAKGGMEQPTGETPPGNVAPPLPPANPNLGVLTNGNRFDIVSVVVCGSTAYPRHFGPFSAGELLLLHESIERNLPQYFKKS